MKQVKQIVGDGDIIIRIYYGYDDKGNILVDTDMIRKDFEARLKQVVKNPKDYIEEYEG